MSGPGLVWSMQRGGPVRAVLVVGRSVVLRSEAGVWRSGLYSSEGSADAAAVRWTGEQEGEGFRLSRGPVVVDLSGWDGATGRVRLLDVLAGLVDAGVPRLPANNLW